MLSIRKRKISLIIPLAILTLLFTLTSPTYAESQEGDQEDISFSLRELIFGKFILESDIRKPDEARKLELARKFLDQDGNLVVEEIDGEFLVEAEANTDLSYSLLHSMEAALKEDLITLGSFMDDASNWSLNYEMGKEYRLEFIPMIRTIKGRHIRKNIITRKLKTRPVELRLPVLIGGGLDGKLVVAEELRDLDRELVENVNRK